MANPETDSAPPADQDPDALPERVEVIHMGDPRPSSAPPRRVGPHEQRANEDAQIIRLASQACSDEAKEARERLIRAALAYALDQDDIDEDLRAAEDYGEDLGGEEE